MGAKIKNEKCFFIFLSLFYFRFFPLPFSPQGPTLGLEA